MQAAIRRQVAAFVALLLASVASATVRPPIHVDLADKQLVVEQGREFRNVLEIRAGFPLSVSDIALDGAGWSVQLELAQAKLTAQTGEVVRIPFRATSSRDVEPMELRFTYDGETYTQTLDLSPSAFRRAKEVRATQVVQAPDASLDASALARPGPAPTELQVEESQPGAGKVGRWVRVRGRFGSFLPAPAGEFRGTDGASVYVMDQRFPGDPLMIGGQTDAQGYFDLTFWWDPCPVFCDSSLDIYVRFELANAEATVGAPFPGGVYVWQTGAWVNYQGSDLNIGTHVPGNPADYAAPHFLTSMTRTWRWFNARGYDTPGLAGVWPDAGGTFYMPEFWPISAQIHLSPDRQWEDSVISHEWGHHWMVSYASSPSPAYCNGICDPATGCTHCIWCNETADIAVTEGAPDWMGDVIPREYPGVYGGSISGPAYNFEFLDTCQEDGTYHNPQTVEGYFAALLRDIEDATQDDHWQYFLGSDMLANMTGEILYTLDAGHPLAPLVFLNLFKSYYPSQTEQLWSTAANCGYEIDLVAPAVVQNFSSSHAISVGQVDDTVDFFWTRAPDDVSGTSGYSISILASASLPDAAPELGNVTSFTSSSLAPGSYYFNIRAMDASGKWSPSYYAYGPFVILTPPPVAPDLAFSPGDASWADRLVPRPAADANFFSAPAPALLPADTAFWWNARYGNYGSAGFLQASRLHFHVDQHWLEQYTFSDPGSFYGYALNRGPHSATGGRHTLSAIIDAWNEVDELNESNNWFGHQYVYEPQMLTPDVEQVRNAPPYKDGGVWMIVDGSPIFRNADGVRLTAASWWSAVVLHSDNPAADYDLELYAPSSGPNSGFDWRLAASEAIGGYTDAVIVNHNWTGWTTYDAGIVNFNYGSDLSTIEHVSNQYMGFNTVTNSDFGAGDLLRLWEIYLDPATMGNNLTLRVRKPAGYGSGALTFSLLNSDFVMGPISSGFVWATDDSGFGFLNFSVSAPGYFGIVLQREPNQAAFAEAVEVSVVPAPPDFQPGWEAMWWSPLVPRPAFDGTPTTVFAPTVLYGDQNNTYLNIDSANFGLGAATSMRSDIDLDGNWIWWVSYGYFPGGFTAPFNWNVPWTIPAGRHTLALRTDGPNEWSENLELNNFWGEQWLWDPASLTFDTPTTRVTPPDPYGGWSQVTSGEPLWPNVDAVRSPTPNISGNDGYWTVVAAMPGAYSDVDLGLHTQAISPKNGLDSYLASSYWGGGQSEFVIRNYNYGSATAFDVSISRWFNTENYTVDSDRSTYLMLNPGVTHGPFPMNAGEIVDIYETYLGPGQQQIALYADSGAIDWGLSVYGPNLETMGKSDMIAGGYSDQNGVGLWEHCALDVSQGGYYAIVVWKAGSNSLNETGTYRLAMLAGATDAEEDVTPTRTQISSIQPNPFNPRTTITFELSKAGRTRLQVYDSRGRMLRTLVDEPLAVGRHERTWNGLDDRGQQVASGVYYVHFEAADRSERQKIVLVK